MGRLGQAQAPGCLANPLPLAPGAAWWDPAAAPAPRGTGCVPGSECGRGQQASGPGLTGAGCPHGAPHTTPGGLTARLEAEIQGQGARSGEATARPRAALWPHAHAASRPSGTWRAPFLLDGSQSQGWFNSPSKYGHRGVRPSPRELGGGEAAGQHGPRWACLPSAFSAVRLLSVLRLPTPVSNRPDLTWGNECCVPTRDPSLRWPDQNLERNWDPDREGLGPCRAGAGVLGFTKGATGGWTRPSQQDSGCVLYQDTCSNIRLSRVLAMSYCQVWELRARSLLHIPPLTPGPEGLCCVHSHLHKVPGWLQCSNHTSTGQAYLRDPPAISFPQRVVDLKKKKTTGWGLFSSTWLKNK